MVSFLFTVVRLNELSSNSPISVLETERTISSSNGYLSVGIGSAPSSGAQELTAIHNPTSTNIQRFNLFFIMHKSLSFSRVKIGKSIYSPKRITSLCRLRRHLHHRRILRRNCRLPNCLNLNCPTMKTTGRYGHCAGMS